MKRILFIIGLACGIARADSFSAPQPSFTYLSSVSSMTTTIISVSTSAVIGATQVDSPQMAGRTAIEIQNIDTSANLWCLPVSTIPVVNAARKIPPGGWWDPNSVATYYQTTYSTSSGLSQTSIPVKFWCLSDGTSATKAAVSQAY